MRQYYLFKTGYILSKFLPAWLGYWLCSLAGGLVFYLVPSIRRAIMDNLRHVLPRSTEHERRNIARKVVRNQYKNYYDLLRLPHLSAEDVKKLTSRVHGRERFDEALAQGKGFIMLSAHIGSFSMVAQLTSIWGYKVAIVTEDIKPEKMYNFINRLRGRFGTELISTGSTQVRTIYRLLRDGGILALAADRDVTHNGLPVQFFDAVADLPEGPVVLAMRLNVPLVPAFTWRLRNNKNRAIILPPVELQRTGNYEEDLHVNMRRVARLLEKMILRAPDQWMALQPVWNRDYTESEGPDGDKRTPQNGHGNGRLSEPLPLNRTEQAQPPAPKPPSLTSNP